MQAHTISGIVQLSLPRGTCQAGPKRLFRLGSQQGEYSKSGVTAQLADIV